ncbi:MAG: hypothetical protein ACLQVX_21045 [Limisphaerales bacterium]
MPLMTALGVAARYERGSAGFLLLRLGNPENTLWSSYFLSRSLVSNYRHDTLCEDGLC